MKYFTIEELCKSDTATRLGIENIPTDEHKQNLIALVDNILDKAREVLGMPIRVTSGYRGYALNKAVGGVKTSDHCNGCAVDITCKDNYKLIRVLQDLNLPFKQIIWEKGKSAPQWVHLSYKAGANKCQKLKTYDGKNYIPVEKF